METHPRPIRSLLDASAYKAPPRTPAQQARYDRILGAAELVMATFGRPNITLANFAIGLDMSATTLRRTIVDMDYLLYLVLARHLAALLATLGDIQGNTPEAQQQRRAAYLAATRAPDGRLNHAHTLLLRDSAHLSADLLPEIETQRQALAQALGGGNTSLGNQWLQLLDDPARAPDELESLLPSVPKPAAGPNLPQRLPPQASGTDAQPEPALGPQKAMAG